MVAAAFPIAKLAALVIRQISKPLANAVKARAKTSPFFRTYVCMPPAQFYHWAEVKMKMWSMNLGKPVNIPKLNEGMAIELGAELVGEGLIFAIAAVILMVEYTRSARKEAAREEARVEELKSIQSELRDLYFARARNEAQIRELVRILHVTMPSVEIKGGRVSEEGIPEHHRAVEEIEESGGVWAGLKSIVWRAVDLLLPPGEENGEAPSQHSGSDNKVPTTTTNPPGAAGAGRKS